MKALKSEFIETGKVKYVMKEFPIPSLHPAAVKASEAALCAGDQDAYWPMHDRIFENQKQMRIEDFVRHATDLGLDGDELAN